MQGNGRQRPIGQYLLEPASRDIFPHREFGLDRHTEPRQQGRCKRIGIVGAQRAARCYGRFGTPDMDKAPDLGRGQVGIAETIAVREFSRMGRTAPPVKLLRCADNEPPNLTQPPRDQAGIRKSGNP